jgi:hypothetical protein
MTNAVRDRRLSLHGPMAMPRRGFPSPRRTIGTAASASGPGKRSATSGAGWPGSPGLRETPHVPSTSSPVARLAFLRSVQGGRRGATRSDGARSSSTVDGTEAEDSLAVAGSVATAGSVAVAGSVATTGSVAVAGSAATAGSVAVAGSVATAGSIGILGSVATVFSVGVRACIGCLACVCCRRCVGCIGCIDCVDCVGCLGCIGLRSAVGKRGTRA